MKIVTVLVLHESCDCFMLVQTGVIYEYKNRNTTECVVNTNISQ